MYVGVGECASCAVPRVPCPVCRAPCAVPRVPATLPLACPSARLEQWEELSMSTDLERDLPSKFTLQVHAAAAQHAERHAGGRCVVWGGGWAVHAVCGKRLCGLGGGWDWVWMPLLLPVPVSPREWLCVGVRARVPPSAPCAPTGYLGGLQALAPVRLRRVCAAHETLPRCAVFAGGVARPATRVRAGA